MPSGLLGLGDAGTVFLTRRFDRDGEVRIPYLSFRSAFGLDEGEHLSYEHMTLRLSRFSSRPDEDAREMFSRAAVSALLNNVDDHMRNFGLLRGPDGWPLAPSFDVNPHVGPEVSGTPLTRGGDPTRRDPSTLLEPEVAASFRLSVLQARQRLGHVAGAVAQWREIASQIGARRSELDRLAPAFAALDSVTVPVDADLEAGFGAPIWIDAAASDDG